MEKEDHTSCDRSREKMEETFNLALRIRRTKCNEGRKEAVGKLSQPRQDRREIRRRAIHSSFSPRVFPPRGALKFQNVAIGRARMPTTFAASVCAASHLYQHVSRNQFIFMMYRGSMTQRLAMLVLKRAGAGGEGTKRWRSKKEERKRGREKRWEKYVHAPLFRGRHSGKQTSSACFEQRRVNGEVEKNEDENGFHNGRFPIFLISNLFKFPATVTSERFVRGEESCTE